MAKRYFTQLVSIRALSTRGNTSYNVVCSWLSVRWGFLRLSLKLWWRMPGLDGYTKAWLWCRAYGVDNRDIPRLLDALEE
jgi:hypothetical protein